MPPEFIIIGGTTAIAVAVFILSFELATASVYGWSRTWTWRFLLVPLISLVVLIFSLLGAIFTHPRTCMCSKCQRAFINKNMAQVKARLAIEERRAFEENALAEIAAWEREKRGK